MQLTSDFQANADEPEGQSETALARGSCHALRRTIAAEILRGGANIAEVARLLGRVSARTTQRYTKVAAVDLEAVHARHHPRGRRDARG